MALDGAARGRDAGRFAGKRYSRCTKPVSDCETERIPSGNIDVPRRHIDDHRRSAANLIFGVVAGRVTDVAIDEPLARLPRFLYDVVALSRPAVNVHRMDEVVVAADPLWDRPVGSAPTKKSRAAWQPGEGERVPEEEDRSGGGEKLVTWR